ncbi:hypothetical protein AAF712_000944 [Marasmius tenuissimus]|uniref:NAD(P)-binding domain-containing protein n=1 Tax=Marasmius tenuissimus TaxID=585030 RepID=A0ABR3ADK8_9AGAR
MAPQQILLTGASGFVGGTLLRTVLERDDVRKGQFEITCLIRGEERAKLLREQLGVKTVVADLDQSEIIERAAENADIILDAANADHPKGVGAMVKGLEKRKAATGKTPIMIHLSGTGALTDDAKGEFAAEKVYEDLDCAEIRAIPTSYVHRGTDDIVEKAADAGTIKGYVIMPPLICTSPPIAIRNLDLERLPRPHNFFSSADGRGTGPFSRTSVQIPALIRGTLKLKQAPYIGKGLGLWNGVHVQDLIDLYMVLLEDARSENPKAPTGAEGYYFCATDSYQWKQLAEEVGKRLHAKGVIPTPEARPVTAEEELDVFGAWSGFAYASNSRSKAGKAYKYGWKPKHHTTGLFDSIEAEYEAVIEEGKEQAPKVHFDEMYNLGIATKPSS